MGLGQGLLSSCAQAQGHPAHVRQGCQLGDPVWGPGILDLFLKLANQEDGDSCLPGLGPGCFHTEGGVGGVASWLGQAAEGGAPPLPRSGCRRAWAGGFL